MALVACTIVTTYTKHLLVGRRLVAPQVGRYGLPTVLLADGEEDGPHGARRALLEASGIRLRRLPALVCVKSRPHEGDPRGHGVNLVYHAELTFRETQEVTIGPAYSEVLFVPLTYATRMMSMGLGHQAIVVERRWSVGTR